MLVIPVQFGIGPHKNMNTVSEVRVTGAILEADYHNAPVDNPQPIGDVS